jgi:hypothetical protein
MYAIYFIREFEPGQHWDLRAPDDDPDRKQHWKTGDLWAVGDTPPDKKPNGDWKLHAHLACKEVSAPEEGDIWDREQLAYVKWHENPAFLEQSIAHHEQQLAEHTAALATKRAHLARLKA